MNIFGGRYSADHICQYNTALSCKRNDLKFYGSRAIPLAELAFSLGKKEFSWNILLTAPPLPWESDQFQGGFSFKAIPVSCGWPKVGLWPQESRKFPEERSCIICLFLSQTWRYLFKHRTFVVAFE